MARINLFDFVDRISKEEVSHPDVNKVHVDVEKVTPPQVKEDTDGINPDAPLGVTNTNTPTSEPGPENGGGDGTAHTVDVKKVGVGIGVDELNINDVDQVGGKNISDVPEKVHVKDGLSARDISTSVEEHDEKANLKTIETGDGGTIPQDTDCLVMDIDEATDALTASGITAAIDKSQSEADGIAKDIGDLEKVSAAVESYRQILKGLKKEGKDLSPELAESIRVGLESFDKDFFAGDVVSVEDLPAKWEGDGGANARDTTESKLSGKAKELWAMIKRAWARTVSALADLWANSVNNSGKLRSWLTDLKSKAGVLEGGHQVQLANATRLFIGDTYVGDSSQAIRSVASTATETLVTWPDKLVQLFVAYESKRGFWTNAPDLARILSHVSDILDSSFRGMKELSPSDKAKVPSGFLDVTRLHWSGQLPGNRAFYYGVHTHDSKDINAQVDEGINLTKKYIKMDFSAMPGEETETKDQTIETMSSSEARNVIKELLALLDIVDGHRQGAAAFDKLKKLVTKNAGNDLGTGFFTGDDQQLLSGLIIGSIVTETLTTQRIFMGYIFNMIKAFAANIEANIKAEHGGGETIDA